MFQIPRKKAPGEQPPAQVRGPGANASASAGGGPESSPPKTDSQAKYWEEKVREHAAENLKLHQQLDSITKHRDQLLNVLSAQQQGGAVLEEAKAALEAEAVNARQLEQQLAHLQSRIQDLTSRATEKDQDAAAARQRAAAMEHQLTQGTAELARLRTELDAQSAEQGTLTSELRQQLAVAREASERAELALRDQTARARESMADLASLRLAHTELQRQWEESRKATAELGKRNDELEQRLADRASELQHLRTELDRRGSSYTDEFSLRSRLKEELRHEFNARLAAEQEATARLRRQSEELHARFEEMESAKRELERRAAEYGSLEAALTKQLHASQAATDKAQTNYGKEAARASKLEKTLESLKQAREELHEQLVAERKESAKFKRKVEQLESRVDKSEENLKRARKRVAEGGGQPGDLSDMDLRVRDSVSALARATADLETERRRLESAALQSRLPSLDATRVGHAFVNSFRNQLRPSADNLMHSIRGLLDMSLQSEQKRLAESALENALVIHAGLQEGSVSDTERT